MTCASAASPGLPLPDPDTAADTCLHHATDPLAFQTCELPSMDIIRIILSVILPPLGVFLQVGIGLHFWLNIVLTLCGYIPGIVHAIWIIARR